MAGRSTGAACSAMQSTYSRDMLGICAHVINILAPAGNNTHGSCPGHMGRRGLAHRREKCGTTAPKNKGGRRIDTASMEARTAADGQFLFVAEMAGEGARALQKLMGTAGWQANRAHFHPFPSSPPALAEENGQDTQSPRVLSDYQESDGTSNPREAQRVPKGKKAKRGNKAAARFLGIPPKSETNAKLTRK
ncbi:hypothetical protein DL89DRAFT_259460 [Linderina pennispora]|uniref:Uncharacterized protein n=1 Tax=Linderina pennispora TaxID=61395 RepID=A0A1Y1W242_9FUNG|nr:uncharacterized protein DL89DRAFT_259460 [Linderina pennispora]ORX67600.1 hypothetical protein DL89DRAFT_259460 [Linderina pennispora]